MAIRRIYPGGVQIYEASGMRSKRAHFLRGYRLRSGLENRTTPLRKPGTQLPGPEPNEEGTGVGGINYHGFLPFFLSTIPCPYLWLSIFRPHVQSSTREGRNGGSGPPYFGSGAVPDPRAIYQRGGRSSTPRGEAAPATVIPAGRLGFRRNDPA